MHIECASIRMLVHMRRDEGNIHMYDYKWIWL